MTAESIAPFKCPRCDGQGHLRGTEGLEPSTGRGLCLGFSTPHRLDSGPPCGVPCTNIMRQPQGKDNPRVKDLRTNLSATHSDGLEGGSNG